MNYSRLLSDDINTTFLEILPKFYEMNEYPIKPLKSKVQDSYFFSILRFTLETGPGLVHGLTRSL